MASICCASRVSAYIRTRYIVNYANVTGKSELLVVYFDIVFYLWLTHHSQRNGRGTTLIKMDNYKPPLYLTSAFIAGILLTLGFKDFYPDLERRFRRGRRARQAEANSGSSSSSSAGIGDANENNNKKDIILDDRTCTVASGIIAIGDGKWNDVPPDGIEACVGNTPLFRIKSLSDETGCEIFAKAEVWNT